MRPSLVAIVLAVAVGVTACSDGDSRESLTVLAASSLTGAFGELERTYEAEHPDVDVRISYGSSATLAEQVAQGAPADVFASADVANMAKVVQAGEARGEQRIFARNHLVLVTPPDDPADIDAVADLQDPSVTWVVCVPEAPCGALAATVLADHGITAAPASEEENVRSVLTKVTAGEADAGLVYVTDALAAGADVRTVPIPGAERLRNAYPVTVLAEAEDPDAAQAWVDLLLSAHGQATLVDAGFTTVR